MTIALGFKCNDGMVLCTDSLENDGQTKYMVNKIWSYETQGEWGLAVASAGEASFAESFTDNLDELFTGERYDKEGIMSTLRNLVSAAHSTYQNLNWEALFALFGPDSLDYRLLQVTYKSRHIAPVVRFQALGMGGHLAKFFCSQVYTPFMTVDEAVELGVFVVKRCKEHVVECDGPTSVIAWKLGQKEWSCYPPSRVSEIESRFDKKQLCENLLNFWVAQTPHLTRLITPTPSLREGGSVQFRRALGLKNTLSGSQNIANSESGEE
jgi:20S proteasome alpha/beta subunit